MRIISGTARGASITAPPGYKTRPTADRVREALFNIIAPDIYGARFLDLFAGSGAVGLEALSREAAEAVFVDKNRQSADFVRANISKLRFEDKSNVLCMDALSAMDILANEGRAFDFIYVDPPYDTYLVEDVLAKLSSIRLLTDGGMIVIETGHAPEFDDGFGKFEIAKQKKYGGTYLTFITERQ
ncbi:MAG: 16S rRNA (guanine(966)-N(2))-methyltransferase RsmD [Defluviitaleaceae bacterium]|nr:16S rRNA (guanine(966)-N(2))-methyltransferase RsmD [Defluviitaleaceae bacterium]